MTTSNTKNFVMFFCIAMTMLFLNYNFSYAQHWTTSGNNAWPPPDAINAASYIGSNIAAPLQLRTTQAQPILFQTNSTERMRLLSTGEVRVGDRGATPRLLNVRGGINNTQPSGIFIHDNQFGGTLNLWSDGTATGSGQTHIQWGGSGLITGSVDGQGGQFQITASNDRPLVFRQHQINQNTTIVTTYIHNNGNVGIGPNFSATSLPQDRLDVDGFIRERSLKDTDLSSSPNNSTGIVISDNTGKFYTKKNFTGINADVLRGDGSWAPVAVLPPLTTSGFLNNNNGTLSWATPPSGGGTGDSKVAELEKRLKILVEKLEVLLLASAK